MSWSLISESWWSRPIAAYLVFLPLLELPLSRWADSPCIRFSAPLPITCSWSPPGQEAPERRSQISHPGWGDGKWRYIDIHVLELPHLKWCSHILFTAFCLVRNIFEFVVSVSVLKVLLPSSSKLCINSSPDPPHTQKNVNLRFYIFL